MTTEKENIVEKNTEVDVPGGVEAEDKTAANLDMEHFEDDKENLIETIEDGLGGVDVSTGGTGQEKSNTADEADAKDKTEEKEVEEKEKASEKDEPAEAKTPDISELSRLARERDEAIRRARELEERYERQQEPLTPDGKKIPDISKMTDEELLDWQADDPKGYVEAVKRHITDEVVRKVEYARKNEEIERIKQEDFDSYLKANPDNKEGTGLVQMWESGAIQKFMDSHPAYPTAVAAHMAMTQESRLKSIEESIRKEERAKLDKERKANVRTVGLGKSPGHSFATEKDETANELRNTKKRGGLVTALTDRLRQRRKQLG